MNESCDKFQKKRRVIMAMTTRVIMVLTVAALVAAISGCTKLKIRQYCKEMVECEGGNKDDEQACRAELKGEYKVAKAYGCGSEARDAVDCLEEKSSCKDKYYTTGDDCGKEYDDVWECEEKASGYSDDDYDDYDDYSDSYYLNLA
jgi:hypothetical protein